MNQSANSCIALTILTVALAGCALPRENAVFVTKTSFSVFDVDATPASASIAYDRVEGYIGPRFADGSIYPVASSLETSGKGFNRVVKQVYVTGRAAEVITTEPGKAPAPTKTDAGGKAAADPPADRKVVIFATATSAGLKLSFVENSPLPTSFALGYKRKELSIIPVDPGRQPSVLATYDNSAGLEPPLKDPLSSTNFEVQQFFATGTAAINLAANDDVRKAFGAKAVRAVETEKKYRFEEAAQGRISLDTLACFVRIDDRQLSRVWNNAEDLGVFGDRGTVDRIRRDDNASQQRTRYTGEMSLLQPDSTDYTSRLLLHKTAVCRLVSPT